MPLEDDFSDIIKKARTGLKLSVGDVVEVEIEGIGILRNPVTQ